MNTFINAARKHTLATFTAVALAMTTAPSSISAQEKGAELLTKLNRPATTAPAAAKSTTIPTMSCPKCVDTVVSVAQPMGRGGRVESANVVRHGCTSCESKRVTIGTGRQAKDVVTHDCKMGAGGATGCCAQKKG